MKKDCFAYVEMKFHSGNCLATRRTSCENCPFYKTKEQVEKEAQKTKERLKEVNYESVI